MQSRGQKITCLLLPRIHNIPYEKASKVKELKLRGLKELYSPTLADIQKLQEATLFVRLQDTVGAAIVFNGLK